MKKSLQFSIFMCVFLIGTTSRAQVTMGIRAGVNVASYAFDFGSSIPANQQPNVNSITGLTVGIPVEIMISKRFAIQAELNYIQKGFGSKSTSSGSSGGTTFSFSSEGKNVIDWLELPILAKAKFGSANGVGWLFFGPSFGYGLSGKGTGTSTSTINGVTKTSTETSTLDFKRDGHSRLDIGVNIGGELTYSNFFFDARYQLGVTNMFREDDGSSNKDIKGTTRGLGLSVGYRFLVSK